MILELYMKYKDSKDLESNSTLLDNINFFDDKCTLELFLSVYFQNYFYLKSELWKIYESEFMMTRLDELCDVELLKLIMNIDNNYEIVKTPRIMSLISCHNHNLLFAWDAMTKYNYEGDLLLDYLYSMYSNLEFMIEGSLIISTDCLQVGRASKPWIVRKL